MIKVIFSIVTVLYSLGLSAQKVPTEIKHIDNSAEYSTTIDEICKSYGSALDSDLQLELRNFNYYATIGNFMNDDRFKKLYKRADQTTLTTLISREYGINYGFAILTLDKETYIFSCDQSTNKIVYVCSEKNSNSFRSIQNTLQDQGHQGLILIVDSFPDGTAAVEVIKGLSILQMQTLLLLEQFARNIRK